jgi:hypothetical protein
VRPRLSRTWRGGGGQRQARRGGQAEQRLQRPQKPQARRAQLSSSSPQQPRRRAAHLGEQAAVDDLGQQQQRDGGVQRVRAPHLRAAQRGRGSGAGWERQAHPPPHSAASAAAARSIRPTAGLAARQPGSR